MPRIEPVPWDDLEPAARVLIEQGVAEGRFGTTVLFQVVANSPSALMLKLEMLEKRWHFGLLEPRLQELVRLRSAQVNSCEPCSISRKEEDVGDAVVACLAPGAGRMSLSPREQAALRFVDLFCTDHLAIDDETFRELSQVFTAAEIVELGELCAWLVGAHRWNHALAAFSTDPAVVRYDPSMVGVGRSS